MEAAAPPPDLDRGLARTLGIKIQELSAERVAATMPITERLHQPLGYLHGGASVALAETVASIGAFQSCPPGKAAFGLEINANHLRPKRSGTLTAIGVPLHRGRSTQVWEIKLYDEAQKIVCVARCTVAIVEAASPASTASEP